MLIDKEKLLEKELMGHIIRHRIEADKAYLVVLSDVHTGLNDRNSLQKTVEFILTVPNVYVILGGDSTNTITRNSKGNVLEEKLSGDKQLYAIVEDMKPLYEAGRLIGICSGNHPKRVQDETFINTEMIIATLLGDPKLYMGSMCLFYINVNKNCYVGGVIHKGSKQENYFEYLHADLVFREHFHLNKVIPKIVIDHNRTNKKPIVKTVYDIFAGSYQIYPDYGKSSGYRPLIPGTHFVELSGLKEKWGMKVFTDNDFYDIVKNGYKV